MKIAVTGKGGVGKTTISGLLCKSYSDAGRRVVAVDADPDANLWSAIGFSEAEAEKIRPITSLKELIEERTGVKPGQPGGVYRLNPRVDDIPEIAGIKKDNIRLLAFGKSKDGGGGCYCPENSLLKNLLAHLVLGTDDVVIIDTEAGIEHISRGTAEGFDYFIIVVEPGQKSIQTARTIKEMALAIGVKNIVCIANKVSSEDDLEKIKKGLGDINLMGHLWFDRKISSTDLEGRPPFEGNPNLLKEISEIKELLE